MAQKRPASARRRGATAVETAVVISVALLFIFGIIEYARLLYFFHVADNAVREGARYACVRTGDGTTTAQVEATVTAAMHGQDASLTGYTVTVFYADTTTGLAKTGFSWTDVPFTGAIGVEVRGNYTFVLPTFLKFGGPTLPIRVRSMMNSEAN